MNAVACRAWQYMHIWAETIDRSRKLMPCDRAEMSAASHSRHIYCSVECTGSLLTSEVRLRKARLGPGRQGLEWTHVL